MGFAKQKRSFDKKKAICKECNSTLMRCENCSSIFSFSGIEVHIKKLIKIVFPRVVYSPKGLESTNKIKPVDEIIKSNTIDGEAVSRMVEEP